MLRISAKWHTTDSYFWCLTNLKKKKKNIYNAFRDFGHITSYQQAIFDLALGVYSQMTHWEGFVTTDTIKN